MIVSISSETTLKTGEDFGATKILEIAEEIKQFVQPEFKVLVKYVDSEDEIYGSMIVLEYHINCDIEGKRESTLYLITKMCFSEFSIEESRGKRNYFEIVKLLYEYIDKITLNKNSLVIKIEKNIFNMEINEKAKFPTNIKKIEIKVDMLKEINYKDFNINELIEYVESIG